jgi:hypothetical protein
MCDKEEGESEERRMVGLTRETPSFHVTYNGQGDKKQL